MFCWLITAQYCSSAEVLPLAPLPQSSCSPPIHEGKRSMSKAFVSVNKSIIYFHSHAHSWTDLITKHTRFHFDPHVTRRLTSELLTCELLTCTRVIHSTGCVCVEAYGNMNVTCMWYAKREGSIHLNNCYVAFKTTNSHSYRSHLLLRRAFYFKETLFPHHRDVSLLATDMIEPRSLNKSSSLSAGIKWDVTHLQLYS